MSRTLLITGATGFIGHHLVQRRLAAGDHIIALSRDVQRARSILDAGGSGRVEFVGDLKQIPADKRIDAIVNLAGERILGLPWTAARRRRLLGSRIDTTQAIVRLAQRLQQRPQLLVSASAIGYYGIHGDEPLAEDAPPQAIFQSQLCQQWEQAAQQAEALGIRVVRLRIGVVLGRDGGALPQLARPVRLGLGAVLGDGRAFNSWIHLDDLLGLIEFAIGTPGLDGAVNATSPQPVTHRETQRALAEVLRRPLWLRMPAFLLRGLLGDMAQLLVDGQRVLPAKALAAGFQFSHPELRAALQDLLVRPA